MKVAFQYSKPHFSYIKGLPYNDVLENLVINLFQFKLGLFATRQHFCPTCNLCGKYYEKPAKLFFEIGLNDFIEIFMTFFKALKASTGF